MSREFNSIRRSRTTPSTSASLSLSLCSPSVPAMQFLSLVRVGQPLQLHSFSLLLLSVCLFIIKFIIMRMNNSPLLLCLCQSSSSSSTTKRPGEKVLCIILDSLKASSFACQKSHACDYLNLWPPPTAAATFIYLRKRALMLDKQAPGWE